MIQEHPTQEQPIQNDDEFNDISLINRTIFEENEENTGKQNKYYINLMIHTERDILNVQPRGALFLNFLDSSNYTFIPYDSDFQYLTIERFITCLKCLENHIVCDKKWKLNDKKDYYINDLLYRQNITENIDSEHFEKIGNIYISKDLSHGKLKIISSKFNITKDYFEWRPYNDGRPHTFISKSFFESENSEIYSNVLKKLDYYNTTCLPSFIRNMISENQSVTTHYRKNPKHQDFYEYFKKLTGHKYIIYSNTTEYQLKFENRSVQCLAWIPPWTKSFLQYIKFNEIDATFKSTNPYAGFSFTGVYKNSGIPLIFVLAPTESLKAYDFGMKCLQTFIKDEKVSVKPMTPFILADRGAAIVAFCTKYNLFHFFCWKHLLENIGNNSKMLPILYWINSSNSIDELNNRTSYAKNLISDERYANDKSQKKMEELLSCTEHWAKIMRLVNFEDRLISISSSSNHQESQHKTFNAHIECKKIELRLKQIFEDLENRVNNFLANPNRNAKNKLKQLINLSHYLPDDQKVDSCNCFDSIYSSSLYEINDFPCVHTIENSSYVTINSKIDKTKNNKYSLPKETIDIVMCETNSLYEYYTDDEWSKNNLESSKKTPINYKIRDVPTSNLCDFGRQIMNPDDLQIYQRFYYYTIHMLQLKNKSRDEAIITILNKIMKRAFNQEKQTDEFYFKLSLQIIEGDNDMTQEEIDNIYEAYKNFQFPQ